MPNPNKRLLFLLLLANYMPILAKEAITLTTFDKYQKNGEIIFANLGDKSAKYSYFVYSDLNKISYTLNLSDKLDVELSRTMSVRALQTDFKNNNFYFTIYDSATNNNIAALRYDNTIKKAVLEEYTSNQGNNQTMEEIENFISFSLNNKTIVLTKKRNFELIKSILFYDTRGDIIFSSFDDFAYQLKFDINNISGGMYFFRIITDHGVYIKKFPIVE